VITRRLGTTGIEVSEIGFGTWAIGGVAAGTIAYGPTDDQESVAALREARALGCTFFDTSNLYGWGHAETLLGQAFVRCRESIVIATKAGYVSADGNQDFSSDTLYRSLEASLERLQTTYVDLLQLHNPPPEALDDEWLLAAVQAMQDDGLIRAWGISARTPDEALLFATRYRPACVQVNFNLGDLRALRCGLFATCRDLGVGIVVRTPLAAGFLTGQLGEDATFEESDHRSRYDAATRARWVEAVRRLNPIFDDAPDATPAQNAIRYALSFDAVSSVIPGMMRVSQVREDLAASRLPRLTARQLAGIAETYDRVFA
jgi:aryl-alcohol dehydrogenase-like predicted oxidoreductase